MMNCRLIPAIKILSLSAALVAVPAQASSPERLAIILNGEAVGSVVATTSGDRVTVEYRLDDNGRGPRQHEEIRIGPDETPVSWTIAGTSELGGRVDEHYRWAAGRAEWKSQADAGKLETATPKLYVVNDDSPYALGVYARAALARGGSIETLAGGRIKADRLRETTVGGTPITVYSLAGIHLNPDYLMLDRDRKLFATFNATDVAIREEFRAEVPALLKLGEELESERAKAISTKVAHRFDGPVRIRDVRIFDPRTGQVGGRSTVVVMRDRITGILPGDGGPVPEGQVVIEGEGGTLYPGLADMHAHNTMEMGLFYLAAGVTVTRDMGSDNDFLLGLTPRLDSGELAGPHIVAAGFLEGRSPFSARTGIVAGSLDEALTGVHWYADRGYREIKIYNSFNPDWVRPVAAEAHRLGLGVTGHIPAFADADRVIADGYDTIAHINQLMLGWLLDPREDTRTALRITAMSRAADLDLSSSRVQRTVRAMQQGHIALDTTMVTLEGLMLNRAGQIGPVDAHYLSHMPIAYQRYRKRDRVPLDKPGADQRYRAAFTKLLDTLRMLHQAGIRLLPGTDGETGFTLQREIELYVKAGIPAGEALRLGTLGAVEYLGLEHERGTIERGKLAEFVLVAGDPTKDIKMIMRPRMVMRAGAVYYPAEIYSALGIEPFAGPPTVILPSAPTSH